MTMKSACLFVLAVGLGSCFSAPTPTTDDPTQTVTESAGELAASVSLAHDAGSPECVDNAGTYHMPDPELTPGLLCTSKDPDFDGYRYPSHVAHCKRNVSSAEKDKVAKQYGGILRSDYSKYEFDHLIPLSAGGGNDVRNLWPQPLSEAYEKDKVENEVYNGLKKGTMTQAQAVAKIHAWRPAACP